MRTIRFTQILILLFISVVTYSQVILNQFYASTGNEGQAIVKISPNNGSGKVFSSSGSFGPVTEVQLGPNGRTLFATTGGGSSALIKIDLVTGTESLVGSNGTGFAINGLEFIDGTLYGTAFSGIGGCVLVTIDTSDATLGSVAPGSISDDPVTGIAHNVTAGVTYGIVQEDGDENAYLITINVNNGDTDYKDHIPFPQGIYRGLAFGPDGTLYTGMYTLDSDSWYLTSIDTITGETSMVAEMPDGYPISGLTYYIPQYIYSSPGNGGDYLGEIDVVTGATPKGLIGDYGPVTEIQHDPTGQFLYATTGGGNKSILTIDLQTGDETLISTHPFGSINGMEFHNYTLYGSFFNPTSSDSSVLVKINPHTGDLTTVGPMTYGPVTGLAYDYDSRTMYGMSVEGESNLSELVTIDINTGATETLGPISGHDHYRGLTFGPYGNLYSTAFYDVDEMMLTQINPETIEATPLGIIPESVSSLSYYNAPPVPLSNTMIFLSLIGMVVFLVIRIKQS